MGDVPEEYAGWVAPLPPAALVVSRARPPLGAVHAFVKRRADLIRHLTHLRRSLQPDGFVWISWPKRTSKVATDITEDVIREEALPLGFVDIKVCAVSEVWSGLKLVIRVSARSR